MVSLGKRHLFCDGCQSVGRNCRDGYSWFCWPFLCQDLTSLSNLLFEVRFICSICFVTWRRDLQGFLVLSLDTWSVVFSRGINSWERNLHPSCFISRSMWMTICCFFDGLNPIFVLVNVDLHEETSRLSTSHMKSNVTVGLVTLNTGSDSFLFADVTVQSPSCGGNVFDGINGFQEDCVSKANLWNPNRTDNMSPFTLVCLFESPSFIWTEDTVNGSRRRMKTLTT